MEGTRPPLRRQRFEQFLTSLISELNKSRIPYAITGATAASYYGIPRTTGDIDFLTNVSPKNIRRFAEVLEKAGLRADPGKIRHQMKTGYNVLSFADTRSPYRADFIFERGRLKKRKGSLLGLDTFYQPPEQLILAKLRMVKATLAPEKSLKDKKDIAEILAHTKVNIQTIRRIAKKETTLETLTLITRS